jgi:hypothetical protein
LKWPKSSEARQALAALELIAEGADVLQECYALLRGPELLEITPEVDDLWDRLIDWRLRATTRQYCPHPDERHPILKLLNSLLDSGLAASAICRRYIDDGRGFGDDWSDDGELVKDSMRCMWHLDPEYDGPISHALKLGYKLDLENFTELPLPDNDPPTTDETR